MNPILRDRNSLILYLFAWSILALLLSALLVVQGRAGWWGALAFSLPMMVIFAFASLSVWYICRAFPPGGASLPVLLSVLFFAALVSSGLWGVLGFLWADLLDEFVPVFETGTWHRQAVPLLAAAGVTLFLLTAAVHYVILAFETSREAERTALELQVLARNAELKALRAQVNPHFLFNSLNSVSALTAGNPAGARAMTLKLADFLRLTMEYGGRSSITLDQELALVREFLDIEKVRFGNRLTMEILVEDEARLRPIPSLLLLPLVENAVSHGIAHMVEGGTVKIAVQTAGRDIRVTIENPVDRDAPARSGPGVGLENVRQRLSRLSPGPGRLEILHDTDHFLVTLSYPAE